MAIERQHIEATQGEKVSAKFNELHEAEAAVDRLKKAGFTDDQITIKTHGGHAEKDGTFVRGGIEVAVLAADKGDDAERVLGQKP